MVCFFALLDTSTDPRGDHIYFHMYHVTETDFIKELIKVYKEQKEKLHFLT